MTSGSITPILLAFFLFHHHTILCRLHKVVKKRAHLNKSVVSSRLLCRWPSVLLGVARTDSALYLADRLCGFCHFEG